MLRSCHESRSRTAMQLVTTKIFNWKAQANEQSMELVVSAYMSETSPAALSEVAKIMSSSPCVTGFMQEQLTKVAEAFMAWLFPRHLTSPRSPWQMWWQPRRLRL